MIGRTLSHYRILDKLGAGGMGEVYLAEDTELDRRVALKVLPEALASEPVRLERFQREAKAIAALSHRNIVTIYSVEEAEGVRFLTMELVEGKGLDQLLPMGGLPLERLFDIALPLAEALAAAHEKGVTHRDLKPSNVMVTAEGEVKVLDFGLAKREEDPKADRPTEALTDEGLVVGTVHYMSPEQAKGETVDSRTDIFALGVILYEMATGRLPFAGKSSLEVLSSVLRDRPRPVTEINADVPHHLGRIIKRCLEKDPARRFQTARDVWNELSNLRDEIRSGETLASSGAVPAAAPRRLPRWWPAAAVGLLLAAAAVGWLLLGGGRGPGESDAGAAAGGGARRMIVVLPFQNLGASEDEYFAEGVSDEITSRLAKVERLGVISRASAHQYKDERPPTATIGAELGVDYLLEGTVRWERPAEGPSRVRVIPQLIRVADDTQIWSERYERELEGIFEVQSQIAGEVMSALDVTLGAGERSAVEERLTDDPEAYQAYLRGQDIWYQPGWDVERFRTAARMYERAAELDPGFLAAWSMLSQVEGAIYFGTGLEEQLAAARAALDRAEALDPDHPRTVLARGYYHYDQRDFERAAEEFEVAMAALPNDPEVRNSMAYCRRRQGHLEEAVELFEESLELDPRNAHTHHQTGRTLIALRRFGAADAHLAEAIALAPDEVDLYGDRAGLKLSQGDVEGARAVLDAAPDPAGLVEARVSTELYAGDLEGALRLSDEEVARKPWERRWQLLFAAWIEGRLGGEAEARRRLEEGRSLMGLAEGSELSDMAAGNPFARMQVAFYSALSGDDEGALREIDAAIELAAVDRFSGPMFEEGKAFIAVLVGREELALDLLEKLATTSYEDPITAASLRLDPRWDPLRDHPRFQALLERSG